MTLDADAWAVLAVICFLAASFLVWRWTQRFPRPFWNLSSLSLLPMDPGSKIRFVNLSRVLYWSALGLFSLAFIDLRILSQPQTAGSASTSDIAPKEGIAIYLILDQSGSMAEKRGMETKLAFTKKVTESFVQSRPRDLIGLVSFARAANILSPLTLDHKAILEELRRLQVAPSQEEDGTAIGYAIFKTANLIAATKQFAQDLKGKGKPAYEIQNSIMVLVTDGVQDPNPRDQGKEWRNIEIVDAAKHAKEIGVKLYVINIEPKLASEEFAPHRRIMQKAAEITGGQFYMVDSQSGLSQVYRDIEELEKSALPALGLIGDNRVHLIRTSFYPWLIGFGLFTLLCALFCEAVFFKETP